MAAAPPDILEMTQVGDVTVGRFTRRTILDPGLIETVGNVLRALVAEGVRKLVLNFQRVESMTSGMLGTLVQLYHDIEAAGGRLVFCHVDAFLKEIFVLCKIPEQIPVLPDEAAALQALA